jgi:PIN domain nuclease of toxin-antitoxin system
LRLLLDTHIWLWTLSDPKRLGRRVVQQLKDEANELWLSPISAYEALTLHYKGRFEGSSAHLVKCIRSCAVTAWRQVPSRRVQHADS